jgi:hypothetical protein
MRRRVIGGSLLLLGLGFAHPTVAQTRSWQPFLSAGTELVGFKDGSEYRPGYVLRAGIATKRPDRRIGSRLTAFGFQRQYPSQVAGEAPTRNRVLGLALEGTLDLASGALRPYALASAGAYRLAVTQSHHSGDFLWRDTQAQGSAAIGLGLGMRWRMQGVTLLLESQAMQFSNRLVGQHLIPVTLGVQF